MTGQPQTNTDRELDAAIRFVVDHDAAVVALQELQGAMLVSLDVETVARDASGNLYDLDLHGPGPLRVNAMAGRFLDPDAPSGFCDRVYVFDHSPVVAVDPDVLAIYAPAMPANPAPIDLAALAPMFRSIKAYAWNADFDEGVLGRDGVRLAMWWDLMLAEALLHQGGAGSRSRTPLAQAASRRLGVDLDGKGSIQLSYTVSDPLSVEQVRYAAEDALVTLRLAPLYNAELIAAGLLRDPAKPSSFPSTFELECGARPFRAWMERAGIAFDAEGWRGFLKDVETRRDESEIRLAALSGGGQATLFDPVERPTWKPSSPEDVKKVLNRFAEEQVRAKLEGRLFEKPDSVDDSTLKLLRHPLADEILAYRGVDKILSTYGEKFLTNVRDDGRIHAKYNQTTGTATGRMSSDRPNMQNLAPEMKAYFAHPMRPVRTDDGFVLAPDSVVLVCGDLGQAELRTLADESKDPGLIQAFNDGADMHVVTASRMFRIEVAALKSDDLAAALEAAAHHRTDLVAACAKATGLAADEAVLLADDAARSDLASRLAKLYKSYRQQGKTMNFAVIYGLGPSALADTLTEAGVDTTVEEARQLQKLYLEAYPEVAKWLKRRDEQVQGLSKNLPACDFEATMRLHKLWSRAVGVKNQLKKRNGSWPDAKEIAEVLSPRPQVHAELEQRLGRAPYGNEITAEMQRRTELVAWALSYPSPVVLQKDLKPFEFHSFTKGGRRRCFNVSTDQWISSMASIAATSKKPGPVSLRTRFEADHGVSLSNEDGSALTNGVLKKRFENKALKESYVTFVIENITKASGSSLDAAGYLMREALSDTIRSMGNAFRNAPIQGGVADVVFYAFSLLYERLERFETVKPVQSVHDSIVLECAAFEAAEVATVLQSTMQEAMSAFYPAVPAIADVEVQASLDASDEIGLDLFTPLAALV